MEVKQGYKQTEVGLISEDWTVKRLEEVADIHSGGTPSTSQSHFWDGDILWCTPTDITALKGRKYLNDTARKITLQGLKSSSADLIPVNSLVMTSRATIGECAINQQPVSTNQGFKNFIPNKGTDTEFLYYLLQTKKQGLIRLCGGSTFLEIGKSQLNNFLVQWPSSKAEQEAIAEALSDADSLIESLGQLIHKKRLIKQGAMQELLTGKKRLPGFSGEWEVKPLGDLFSFSGGYSASRDQLSSEGYCYLHYGDIHGASKMIIDTKDDYQNIPKLNIPLKRISSNSLLKDGDVVFVDASEDDGGTSKYIVVVNKDDIPFIAGLHTIVARSKTFELAHEYRCYCFQTADIHKQFLFFAVGTKVSGISKTNITKLMLPVPPYFEQIAIADILMNMDAEIEELDVKLEKIYQLKQGMMHNLLTGKIRLIQISYEQNCY